MFQMCLVVKGNILECLFEPSKTFRGKLLCIIKVALALVFVSQTPIQKLPLEWKTNEKCIAIYLLQFTQTFLANSLLSDN